MKKKQFIAATLSLIAPGSGQIYRGESTKGASILVAAIIIGNLNIIILPLIAIAKPALPAGGPGVALWAYWIPRVVHDVVSFWSIIFWIWAIADAFSLPKKA